MLFSKAKQIVCISQTREKFKFQNPDLCILENASVAIENGIIIDIGDIDEKYKQFQIVDCQNKCILPGFVDCHTHACNAGDRSKEFVMKLEGVSYIQIHQMGGGIQHTVKHVQQSSEEELSQILSGYVKRAQKQGTTTMEVKSGYGLNSESEIKQLRVINNLKCDIDLVQTYCGAHSIPIGMNEQQATEDILMNQIPKIKELKDKGEINPEFIDVFCEKGIFESESTKQILRAGQSIGLIPSFHGEELNHLESATLGADLNSIAISHLEFLSDDGIKAMAQKQVVGVILPTTHFILKLRNPPVRKMLEAGVPVALASDFCPNAHCLSLPLTMSLACLNLQFKPNEALCAITLNAAAALNRSDKIGSIEIGKKGDLVILDAPSWEHIIYQMGDSPIWHVVKEGRIIV